MLHRHRLIVTIVAALTCSARADVLFVDDDNCPGPGSGTELDPFCSIQTAIDSAVDTDEIVVAPGHYEGAVDFLGKAITLRSSAGPAVTVIDGAGSFHAVQCVSEEGPDTILDGFTVTGGNANGEVFPDKVGGGMFLHSSSPIIRNCIFSGNVAGAGGGLYFSYGSAAVVTNCIFVDNSGSPGGGGGAMVVTSNSDATLVNCLFADNEAPTGGAIYVCCGADASVTNCTFSRNSAIEGGAFALIFGDIFVRNCILWRNSPDEIANIDWGFANVMSSDVQGGWGGNLDADPLFVDPDNGDFRLQAGSPCIDAGNNFAVPEGVLRDLDGNPRFVADACTGDSGAAVDMGAYEFQGTSCDLSNVTTHDILWRHDGGQTFIWLMDGTQGIGQGSPGGANPDDWEVAGVGDFDRDGYADILWRHTVSGLVYVWFIEGTELVDWGPVGAASLQWEIVGTGNFDGDPEGGSDILWRNTLSGQVFIWLIDGTQVIEAGSPGTTGQVWQIDGVGDFDGDRRYDILWRHTVSGQVFIWFIDGTQRAGQGPAGGASPDDWAIAGIGDFDGLASTPTPTHDILWRHTTTGQILIWLMDGTTRIGQGSPGSAGQIWQIVDTGDLDGDGHADILWRNQPASGQVFAWFIEGTARVGQGPLGGVSHAWQIAATGDFDGE